MVALQAADLVVLDGDGVVVQTDVAGCVDLTAGDARFIDTVETRFTVSGAPSTRPRPIA